VTASSTLTRLAIESPVDRHPLATDLGLSLPVDPALETLDLPVDAAADTTLEVEVYDTGRPKTYVPRERVAAVRAAVAAGDKQWVRLAIGWHPERAQNAFVAVRANPYVA
jgi:hypothetical protein